jgi:hypothetical protein
MKRFRTLLVLALVAIPTVPALAATPATTGPAATGPVTVARYDFNRGASATGWILENSGRGVNLKIRSSGGATVAFGTRAPGKYVAFPPRCLSTATTCKRVILEGGDDPDLDPGTRPFRWGATINANASQVGTSANVVQKGVATTDSQWKLQIGGTKALPQCVVVGTGTTRAYIAKANMLVTDRKWHQITCVRAATKLTIFVDGTARGYINLPANLNISNNLPLRIGGRNLGLTSDMYNGAIDDVFAVLG